MTRLATFSADQELQNVKREHDAVRIAQIGLAGGIGVCHINEYLRNPHFKLIGGYDLYPKNDHVAEAARQVIKQGGKIYTTFDEVLADPAVEAIDLCTPHHFHRPMALAAFQAGKHVLVEKPLAPHPDDVAAMIAAARAAHKIGAVQMQHIGRSSMLQLRKALQSGAIGPLKEIFLSSLWFRTEDYYRRAQPPADWPGRMKVDGQWCIDGALFNQCVHYITQSLILASAGEPPIAAPVRDVHAALYKFHTAPTLEAGDTAFATGIIDTPDAPRLTLVGTTCSTHERHQIDIIGAKGRALWNGAGYFFVNGEPMQEFQDDRGEFDGNSRVFTTFAQAIHGRGPALTEFANIQNSTNFIFACYEAANWKIKTAPWTATETLFTDIIQRVRQERFLPAQLKSPPAWA